MLFDWNVSWIPFLGQVVDLDLLLCTGTAFNLEFADFFLLPVLFRDQRMIERLSEAMSTALVSHKFSGNPLKFSFTFKKKLAPEKI